MAMNSYEGTHAHSHGNMVAQPVDTITTAAQSSPHDAMSAATIGSGKEANTELSDFDISEDSPVKDTSALHVSANKYRWHTTPRSSPSPTRSKTRRPSLPRTIPIKRSPSSTPTSLAMIPRRGRIAVTDTELWGAEGRMVHRKVDWAGQEATVGTAAVAEQFAADRAATAQLHSAVQALAKAINAHDGELRDHDRRLDEATRLRFDDNKLHQGAVLHVRTGVEAMEQAIKVQGKEGGSRPSRRGSMRPFLSWLRPSSSPSRPRWTS